MIQRSREEWAIFLQALQFLTKLPLPANLGYTPQRFAAAPRYYPLVGLLVGAIAALTYGLSLRAFGPVLAALLSTAASIVVTGAFHEDGFADACDGLGGSVSTERALEIMKDSRLGTYGTLGLGLMVAVKVATLARMPLPGAIPLMFLSHATSRLSSVMVLATSRYVRDQGTAKPVASGISLNGLTVALSTTGLALATAAYWLGGPAVAGGLGGLCLGHWWMRFIFESRLGGYTGDCLGAVQQTSEVGFYLGAMPWL